MSTRRVIFRADGGPTIGLGHISRCLALAEILQHSYKLIFITKTPTESILKTIQSVVSEVIVLDDISNNHQESQIITQYYLHSTDIVVLDGYQFNTKYQKNIKTRGCKLVCIDDIHAYHFVSDVLINHAPEVNPAVYSKEAYTRLCLGPQYALVRSIFHEERKQIYNTCIKNIFICLGGSDQNNITSRILNVLSKAENHYNIDIVLGGEYKNIKTLTNDSKHKVTYHHDLTSIQMKDLMISSDTALVPASSILYELVTLQVPVMYGYYTDNQIGMYGGFQTLGLPTAIGNLNNEKVIYSIPIHILNLDIPFYQKTYRTNINIQSQDTLLKVFHDLTRPA